MTMFSTFDERQIPNFSESQIEGIIPCVLFYVTTGRNAWHSTWVQHYSNGCMHSSLQSAKDHAEKLRTQGTVFAIKEQPCLGLAISHGYVIITQINTNTPLADYSAEALVATPTSGAKLIDNSCNNYLHMGANTSAALLSFDFNSRFWRKPPPQRHSIIVVSSDTTNVQLEPLRKGSLQAWSSYSDGSHYVLGWHERENDVKSAGIKSLVA